jgi:prepilin-type processing-associated H-X9-DG protein
MWLHEERHTNREVLYMDVWWILHRINFKQYPSAESGYYNVLFADGNIRGFKPVLGT